MNEFIDFHTQGFELPPGMKDLSNLLPPPGNAERARQVQLPIESFAQIEGYLLRLLQSTASYRVVDIFSTDCQGCLAVTHSRNHFRLMVTMHPRNRTKEARVSDFFSQRNISPQYDSGFQALGIDMWLCFFPLPRVALEAAELLRELLQQVFGLAENAGLIYTYHEQNAA